MKNKIFILILLFTFFLGFSETTIFANNNGPFAYSTNESQTYLKSGEYMYNEIERQIYEHSESIELEYEITEDLNIQDMELDYETTNNIIINMEETSNNSFSLSFYTNNTGEFIIEIICTLTLNDNSIVVLNDEIFIYAIEEFDFLSKASILDAKFYCYEYLTNTTNPSFEEFDAFYSGELDNNINLNTGTTNLENGGQASTMSMDNINVYGTITWVDREGNSHNAAYITVEIIDKDILGINNVLETTTTNENGQYNASVSNTAFLENGGNDITIRVSAQGGNIKVVNNSGSVYKITKDDINSNYTDTSLQIDFEIDSNDYTSSDDKERANAFRVHQAMNLGAKYVETKKGNRLDEIKVVFPTTKSTSCFTGTELHILQDDKDDWDVMLHEYGHYVSYYYNTNNSSGGTHSSGTCLNHIHGKSKGMPLAWSEGWATYFSISAQLETNSIALNILNVGDTNYTDTVDSSLNYSIESPLKSRYQYGESNEANIAAVLLDLADEENDEGIELGYNYIWNLINNSQCKNMSDFMNQLYSQISDFECAEIGEILSSLDTAPELDNPANNFTCDWNIPTFEWVPNGGRNADGKNYSNNLFTIVFYDRYKDKIFEKTGISNSSYTPTEAEWGEILSQSFEYIYWAVIGYQTTDYTTGGYYSHFRKLNIPSPQNIYLDDVITDTIESDQVNWYKFVAPMTGTYVFESTGSYDTYGELFSSLAFNRSTTNRLIDGYDDDDGEGFNFKIEYDLEYKQVVYIRVRQYSYQSIDSFSLSIICTAHEHAYEYEPVNSQYHILECHCGVTSGSQERHVIDGSYIDPIGNGRYKPCAMCGAAIDTWSGGIFPVLRNNQIIYVMYETQSDDNLNITQTNLNFENQLMNVLQYSVNGSYKLSDGTIILVEEDIDAYFEGTLIFYDEGEIPLIE